MRSIRQQKQSGFTLIELIIVIVIIGILAAVAIPKFIDLQTDARTAALNGIAGNLSSASAANFAIRSGGLSPASTAAITNCNLVGPLLQGGLDAAYAITSTAIVPPAVNTGCVLTHTASGLTTTFTAHGIN